MEQLVNMPGAALSTDDIAQNKTPWPQGASAPVRQHPRSYTNDTS